MAIPGKTWCVINGSVDVSEQKETAQASVSALSKCDGGELRSGLCMSLICSGD